MSQKKILVVDDDEAVRYLLGRSLELEGHRVVRVANGREAWALLDGGEEFEHIFSDYNMPWMGGLELLRRVRADDRTAGIPFVLMSGGVTVSRSDLTPLETICAKLGATFVEKPVDYRTLIARVLGEK